MDNLKNNIPFVPVVGTDAKIKKINSYQDGFVYFATDSKKIYMAHDKELLTMGGNSSIYYGTRKMSEDEIYGDDTDFDFLGYIKDLDENDLHPHVDDLILNEPDGGFYRVIESTPEKIIGKRIAVSGTGSGGGGTGGGSGTTGQEELSLIPIGSRNLTILKTDTCILKYKVVAKDVEGSEVFDEGDGTWRINGQEYKQRIKPNQEGEFRVDQYLQAGKVNNISLTVKISLDGGIIIKTVAKSWTVEVVNLDLEWNYVYSTNNYIAGDNFTISWTPKGGIDCITHINFYNSENVKILSKEIEVPANKTNDKNTENFSIKDATGNLIFPYGVYTCEIYVTAIVNDETKTTQTIKNELTFIKDGSTDLLTVPFYQTECRQYDTLKIPFMIYNPNKDKSKVKFYLRDNSTGSFNLIGEDEYERELQYWPYTVTTSGPVTLKIEAENESIYKDISITANELDIDVSEVEGYAFSLKAANFSTNEQLKIWKINDTLGLTFSENFNWKTGGLKFKTLADGSIEKYIHIPVGTRMTINYAPYPSGTINNTLGSGKNIKICFKATNCYDYNAEVLSCYDETSRLGLRMNAQAATFYLSDGSSTNTQYCENNYIELEQEVYPLIDPDTSHVEPDRFILFWADGIPVGISVYPQTETFRQTNAQSITIGSDQCDVDIYTIKVYNRSLTENEHLRNFIADAPTPKEMLDRYNRNDILVDGQIDPEKLVQQNPGCHAYIYEIPRMTTSKDDKVPGCNYTELYGENNTLGNPYYKAINTGDGARIRVQGTSSTAYGVAAFNLRTEFQEGLIKQSKNDETVLWKASKTAIPIDYVCTKVNVASCENANNVVNQEWYNKFQPYYDAHRRKARTDGCVYRDTMEFNSGVVFIKDNNPVDNFIGADGNAQEGLFLQANVFSDVEGYAADPYYRQYAIGNMGNDKKNIEVFHDTENPKACCVENADNQKATQHMTVEIPYSTEEADSTIWTDEDYEFRYPDEGATLEMKNAFERLVNWMAVSNPAAATNAPLEKEKTYGTYIFKGQDNSATGVSLKGLQVSTYNGTYTTDSYEYRMAKMLHECEDYLVMDSIVFHYLFIQRHTMVDNVAKNTFWSTEDLVHWDLTKDYDNDTADGNNNSGNLVYGYGIEIGDEEKVIIEVDENNYQEVTKGIFNASNSVWLQFIQGLPTVQEALHGRLVAVYPDVWKPETYLQEFNKHQSVIPERCWIYDYFRKYIRPRRIGLDADNKYVKRLEGGKKVHQRNQYETYQGFYIDSKYAAKSPISGIDFQQTGSLDMRLNQSSTGSWNEDTTFPISYYIDCYGSALVGGALFRSERLKKGEKFICPVGKALANPEDATCYVYGARMIQTVEDLSSVYPQYVGVNPAKKLREIEIGSDAEGYKNPFLNQLGMKTNTMLEYIDVQNVGQAAGLALELENATQLKTLLMSGSTIKSLVLPDNGVIETLKLNKLGSIVASNLENIKTFEVDPGYEEVLSSVQIQNCPELDDYTYKFAVTDNGLSKTYSIVDFEWKVTSLDDLEITNGKVTDILALKNLASGNPASGDKVTDLIGSILIDVECKVDEYALYEKYAKVFPNVIINYTEDKVTFEPAAASIVFYTDNSCKTIYYQVKGKMDGSQTLSLLTSASGPLGIAMAEPVKASTNQYTYSFAGWVNRATNKVINLDNIVTESLELYPEFTEKERTYKIEYYNYDNTLLKEHSKIWNEAYNVPGYLYRDDSNLADDETWALIGWAETNYGDDATDKDLITSTETQYATGGRKYYAHFAKQDVRTIGSNAEYFNFDSSTKTISIKEDYRETFKGKLTIPAKYNNIEVQIVGDFSDMPELTHVYFQTGSACHTIGSDAFHWSGTANDTKLIMVELPEKITTINARAFYHCVKLKTLGANFYKIKVIGDKAFSGESDNTGFETWHEMALEISELPSGLIDLGQAAFYYCSSIKGSMIPAGIKILYGQVFVNCYNLTVSEFNNVEEIKSQAFYENNNTTVTSIDIRNVKSIEKDAFKGSTPYYKALNSITYDSSKMSAEAIAEAFGIPQENITWSDVNG